MVERRRAELPGVDILFGSPGPEGAEAEAPDVAETDRDAGSPPPPTPLRDPDPEPVEVDQEAIAGLARVATEAPPFAEGAVGNVDENTSQVGTLLSFIVTAIAAHHVVEIGSPSPATSLWMAGAMGQADVLTTISADTDVQSRLARALRQADVSAHVRTITGEPDEVLPRLSDGGYDVLVAHGEAAGSRRLRDHAARLLRAGGTLILVGVGAGTAEQVRARRALVRELVDDPRFRVSVLAVGGGVALGAIEPEPSR